MGYESSTNNHWPCIRLVVRVKNYWKEINAQAITQRHYTVYHITS